MANWVGTARSNYFHVKHDEAFLQWVDTLPGVFAEQESDGAFVLLAIEGDGWPISRELDEPREIERSDGVRYTEYEEEIDLADELAEHLAEGEVAILEEVGAEKARYVDGCAIAVRSTGETLIVRLDDIYDLVRREWHVGARVAAY